MPPPLSDRLEAVRSRIARACADVGHDPQAVRLVAVVKAVPVARVNEALAAGVADLGESYVQEAMARRPKVAGNACWHFIGPVQGNKAADVAAHFDWVHSIDRIRIAERLSRLRPADREPLQACVQVNVSSEASKSGVAPDAAESLCRAVMAQPNLRLRGLMSVPAPVHVGGDPREPHRRLHGLMQDLVRLGIPLDTLSAGMTDDFEAAIAEGATMIRVGTAIFGPRDA